MADLKISQLPAATVPLAGTEVLPIVQSGTTKQVSVSNVIAGTASIGANTFTAAQEWATGAAISSASTINLNTATGNRVHITGTTAITAVTLTRGPRTLIFDDVLTLTHNATTNNLPGATNITTAAGDRAIYESDGTTVYCVSYIKASGLAILNPVATATTSGLVPTPPNDATKVLTGAMTYVTPASSALVLLSTVTASSSATVDIETTFDSTYDAYLLVVSGMRVSSDGDTINVRLKIGGSYISSGTYIGNTTTQGSNTADTAGTAYGPGAGSTFIKFDPVGQGNGASESSNYNVYINTPSSTALQKQITWNGGSMSNGSSTQRQWYIAGAASNSGTSALTGIRFYAASGSIASGSFRLYGIAK